MQKKSFDMVKLIQELDIDMNEKMFSANDVIEALNILPATMDEILKKLVNESKS